MPDGVFPVKPKRNARAGIDFAKAAGGWAAGDGFFQYALVSRGCKSGENAGGTLQDRGDGLVALATTSAHSAETLRRSDRACARSCSNAARGLIPCRPTSTPLACSMI